MKRLLALLLCLLLCLTLLPAAAAEDIEIAEPAEATPPPDEPNVSHSGECGKNLRWRLDFLYGDSNSWHKFFRLVISGSGDMWDYNNGSAPWYDPISDEQVKELVIEDGATSIGEQAFSCCEYLTSATIGSGVEDIGAMAFYGCTRLESLTIPDCVEDIGYCAFYYCFSLREIVFEGSAPRFLDEEIFYNDVLVAYYPAGDASWTDSVRQNYDGFVLWASDDGPRLTLSTYADDALEDTHFRGGGTVSGGEGTFTLSERNNRPTLVAVKESGQYTALKCTTSGGTHSFTLNITSNAELALVLKGDTNLDGEVTNRDATLCKQALMGTVVNGSRVVFTDPLQQMAADRDGDGQLKSREATFISQVVAGTVVNGKVCVYDW